MDFFKIRENVDKYSEMMNDYNNHDLLEIIDKTLEKGKSILELGMGTGADLIELAKKYQVVGSDNSIHFINDFKKKAVLK